MNNEKKIREITQQSILKPSDRFTYNLMSRAQVSKVEGQDEFSAKGRSPFTILYIACFVLFVLIVLIFSWVHQSGLGLKLPTPVIQIVSSLTVCLLIKKIMLLNAGIHNAGKLSRFKNS